MSGPNSPHVFFEGTAPILRVQDGGRQGRGGAWVWVGVEDATKLQRKPRRAVEFGWRSAFRAAISPSL